jgi:D-glycero-D-manno-heptose 1,7-bisphosphate phosphatase
MQKRKAVFLDRDGTINVNAHYVNHPRQVELLPNATDGLRLLQSLGFLLVVVSNQSGIARGYFTTKDLKKVNNRLTDLLAKKGIKIDGIYCCPYHKHGKIPRYTRDSDCRKPRPGMLKQAAKDFNIDISSSYMVGDMAADIELAKNAGCRAMVYVGDKTELKKTKIKPQQRTPDLLAAAVWIMREEQRSKLASNPGQLGRLLKKQKKIIVSTNGVFDILHPGHLAFLKACRAMGDALVVGLNSDASVRRIKGPSRPVNKEADRVAMLCSLESVDHVVVFSENEPCRLLRSLRPHVHVKDANYSNDEIIGYDEVIRGGGRVVRIPRIGDYATSAVISRVRRSPS